MSKKPSKSETLTIRLDPKTRFMLEFVSRLRGQTITTVVERAITEAANRAKIVHEEDPYSSEKTWRDFWNVIDGVRAIRIAREEELHPTYEEERRLKFAEQFWEFFFTSKSADTPRTGYIEILWPRIDEFISLYDETKHLNYFAAGQAMKKALSDAAVAAPDWPPKAKSEEKKPEFSRDLDDDIPF